MHQHLVLKMEKWNNFMMILKKEWLESDSKYKITTGDFNTKIGTETKEDFKGMGAFAIREKKKRKDSLTEFAEEHKVIISNTLFQKP